MKIFAEIPPACSNPPFHPKSSILPCVLNPADPVSVKPGTCSGSGWAGTETPVQMDSLCRDAGMLSHLKAVCEIND